jgi:GNAT superfamily N-acetyltransferase
VAGRQRVGELRPVRKGDREALRAWLPRVAAEVGCAPRSEPALAEGAQVLVRNEGAAQAFVAYEAGAPECDAAVVRFLAVDRTHRRLGAGYRTVLALEERLARSARRCYVAVPARLGLALYFWLRLGYRPLTRADWPAPLEDAAWMVRELR